MFTHYRSKGIILKEQERGEADRLLTIYTEEFGKIDVSARAIRKINSKLRSGTGTLCHSEIEFIEGKSYKTLTDAILIDDFSAIKGDLRKLKIAYRIAEISDSLLKKQEKEEKVWELLTESFQRLAQGSFVVSYLPVLYYYYFWNFVSLLGYQPELYSCASCRKALAPSRLYFSFFYGGTVCPNCFKKEGVIATHSSTIKILRIILKKDWEMLLRLKIGLAHKQELQKISENFLSVVLFTKERKKVKLKI
ncbi:MAG: DNA repair protein RecO [bacterium]